MACIQYSVAMVTRGVLASVVIFHTRMSLYLAVNADSFCANFPLDVRDDRGVQTSKLPGSRLEYNPFPKNFTMTPHMNMSIEFRTRSATGVIFAAANFRHNNVIGAYLDDGHLIFARRCGHARAFERERTHRLDDGRWHTLMYTHDRHGGRLHLDRTNHFRSYHMGSCSDISSILFGGLLPDMVIGRLRGLDVRHHFSGCIRRLRFQSVRIPVYPPKYYAISTCES